MIIFVDYDLFTFELNSSWNKHYIDTMELSFSMKKKKKIQRQTYVILIKTSLFYRYDQILKNESICKKKKKSSTSKISPNFFRWSLVRKNKTTLILFCKFSVEKYFIFEKWLNLNKYKRKKLSKKEFMYVIMHKRIWFYLINHRRPSLHHRATLKCLACRRLDYQRLHIQHLVIVWLPQPVWTIRNRN